MGVSSSLALLSLCSTYNRLTPDSRLFSAYTWDHKQRQPVLRAIVSYQASCLASSSLLGHKPQSFPSLGAHIHRPQKQVLSSCPVWPVSFSSDCAFLGPTGQLTTRGFIAPLHGNLILFLDGVLLCSPRWLAYNSLYIV